MGWQERLRLLGDRLTAGELTTAEYRVLSEDILAEADRETAETTAPTAPTAPSATEEPDKPKVRIPVSAAWEAPSGEMTQIVGTQDKTTLVNNSIADQLRDETG